MVSYRKLLCKALIFTGCSTFGVCCVFILCSTQFKSWQTKFNWKFITWPHRLITGGSKIQYINRNILCIKCLISLGVWSAVETVLSQVQVFLYLVDSQKLSYHRVTSALGRGVCHVKLFEVTEASPWQITFMALSLVKNIWPWFLIFCITVVISRLWYIQRSP